MDIFYKADTVSTGNCFPLFVESIYDYWKIHLAVYLNEVYLLLVIIKAFLLSTDVAVGAPFLPDGGAVFIYMGSRDGLEVAYRQAGLFVVFIIQENLADI